MADRYDHNLKPSAHGNHHKTERRKVSLTEQILTQLEQLEVIFANFA